jgi:hypothetical protein
MTNRLRPSLFAALVTPQPRRRLVTCNPHTLRPSPCYLHPWRVLSASLVRHSATLSSQGPAADAFRHTSSTRLRSASQPSESLPGAIPSRAGPGNGAFRHAARRALTRAEPVDKLWITCGKPHPVLTTYPQFIHRLSPENLWLSTSYPQVIHRQNRDYPRSPVPLDKYESLCHTIGCGLADAELLTRCCMAYCY